MDAKKSIASATCGRRFSAWRPEIGILVLALLLRLICAVELAAGSKFNSVWDPPSSTDLATYMQLARQVAAGEFAGPFYYQPFYYAGFLAPIYRIFPASAAVVAVICVQLTLSVATVLLAMITSARLFGRRGGYLAGLLTAVSVPLIFYVPYHQNETLQAFNLALLAYLTVLAMRSKALWLPALTGVVLGLAIATRGNLWLMAPGILLFVALRPRASRSAACLRLAAAAFGMLLALSPFIIYNSVTAGVLTGPSTAGNAVLALGNTPEAPPGGREPGLPAGPMEYPESYHRFMADAEHGISVPQNMWRYFRREPLAFLELEFRKAYFFWDSGEIPNNVSLDGEGRRSVVLTALYRIRWNAVALAVGLTGVLLLLFSSRNRRSPGRMAVLWMILSYWLSIALFYNLARFRAPVLPLLAVSSGVLALPYYRRADGRRAALLAAFAALVWVFFSCPSYRACEPVVMRLVRPNGTYVAPSADHPQAEGLDHGPRSFGNWRFFPLRPGMRLGKKIPPRFGKAAGFSWTVWAAKPETLTFFWNGRRFSKRLLPGEQNLELPPASDGSDLVELKVLALSGEVFAAADFQRDYHRSFLDGQAIPAEWVVRWQCAAPASGSSMGE